MNVRQFTVEGVTYEVHQKTIRDGLAIDWLYAAFIDAGYKGKKWTLAYAFANFLVSTKVVDGGVPAFMVPTDADVETLTTALELWLDQTSELSALWDEAIKAVELSGNDKALSPQADPNA